MVSIPTIYTHRDRQENEILIRTIWDAYQDKWLKVNDEMLIAVSSWSSGKDIPNLVPGSEKFGTQYHPSLFSLLDEYERRTPLDSNARVDFEVLNEYLFCLNFPKILSIRKDEIPNSGKDLSDEIQENIYFYRFLCKNQKLLDIVDKNNANSIQKILKKYESIADFKVHSEKRAIYEKKCKSLRQELNNIKDRTRVPEVLSTVLTNGILYHLDKLSSREETLSYLRGENVELPLSVPFQRNKLVNREQVQQLKKFLTVLIRKADGYGFGLIKRLSETGIEYLEQCDILTLNEFEGEYVHGMGVCTNCSMVFASNALASIDSSCKFLYEYGPGWVYLPASLNYIECPFCNTKAKIDTPAMFHSLERMQTIYCIPSNWKENKKDGIVYFAPFFEGIRNGYKKRLSKRQISMFDRSSVIYAYGWNEFVYAIQMGHVEPEGHVYTTIRTPDGNGLLLDSAKKVAIGIPKEHLVYKKMEDEKSVLERDTKLRRAIELHESGDLIKSKQILENLVQEDPNNRFVNANLAIVLNAIGEKERSQEIFQNLAKNQGLGTEFNKRSSYFQKGMQLVNSRKYEEAIKSFDAALSFDPNYLLALDSKGYSLFRLGKFEEAMGCYDRVLQIAIGDSDAKVLAWTNKGAALSKLARYDEAIKSYDKAIETEYSIEIHYFLVWYNNGVTLSKLGRYEESVKLFDKSLELNAEHAGSWYWRARSKIKMGDTNGGLIDLKKAIELDPVFTKLARQERDLEELRNDKQFLKLVAAHKKTVVKKASKEYNDIGTTAFPRDSKWEEEVDTLLNIQSNMPYFAEIYYGLGVTLFKSGRYEESVKLFDKSLELNAEHAGSWYWRARSKIKMGDTNGGLIDLKKAIELDQEYMEWVKNESDFDEIRDDRWFAKLLAKYK